MIEIEQIQADLQAAMEEHGVEVLLLSSSEVQRNALGEEIGAVTTETPQTVIPRPLRATFGSEGVELPEGTMEFIALSDSLVSVGAMLQVGEDRYHVSARSERVVLRTVVAYIFTAERADANGRLG